MITAVAFGLAYLILVRVLSWLALLARSDACGCRELRHRPRPAPSRLAYLGITVPDEGVQVVVWHHQRSGGTARVVGVGEVPGADRVVGDGDEHVACERGAVERSARLGDPRPARERLRARSATVQTSTSSVEPPVARGRPDSSRAPRGRRPPLNWAA